MPLTVYGDDTAQLSLLTDPKKDAPRTLLLKFLSKREIRQWQKRLEQAYVIQDEDERDTAYDKLLSEVVTGWKNIDGTFSVEAISDNFTIGEFMELMRRIPYAMVPGVEDAKK